MANNPKKVKDPTEVALSAIQEALNINDPSADANRNAPRSEAASPTSTEAPVFNEASFEPRPAAADRPVERPMFIDEQRPTRRPANDDRETIGQLLQAIQKGRPARSVYTIATLFAAVWVVGCAILTIGFLAALQAVVGQGGGVLVLAGLTALFFAPVLLFYFLANLAWRGQELRMIAQANWKPWSPTRSRRWSAPIPTTRCGSARCCRTSPISVTTWSDRPNRCAARSPACRSICATTSR